MPRPTAREELDEVIDRHAHGWSVQRIQPLERSIMRVALIEMLHPDVAPGESRSRPRGRSRRRWRARRCSAAAERPAFVNGVLAAVLREVRENAPQSDDAERSHGCDHLDDLIARLERAAEQLRSGELSADAAATMVEDCAALATQAAAELEAARAAS